MAPLLCLGIRPQKVRPLLDVRKVIGIEYLVGVWSWLGSPAVGILGLLSSVITIAQVIIYLGRFVKGKMPRTDDQRKRIYTAVALAGLAAVAVISPLTWSGVTTEYAKIGDHGTTGTLETTGVTLGALVGALLMLLAARLGIWLIYPFAACMLMALLTFEVAADLASRNVGWANYLMLATVSALGVVALLLSIINSWHDARASRDPQTTGGGALE
jgi:hypothetical protein